MSSHHSWAYMQMIEDMSYALYLRRKAAAKKAKRQKTVKQGRKK